MNEPSKMAFKVNAGERKPSKIGRLLTLDQIKEWIAKQGFDEYTTKGLIELASNYPTQALPHFQRNFNLMLQRVRQKRHQEQQGVIHAIKEDSENQFGKAKDIKEKAQAPKSEDE
jgi:hypothetical protein